MLWLIWNGKLPREHVLKRYEELTGRKPKRVYSPKKSATEFWWTGNLTRDEYDRLRRDKQHGNTGVG